MPPPICPKCRHSAALEGIFGVQAAQAGRQPVVSFALIGISLVLRF
jgi:hypothetical protein